MRTLFVVSALAGLALAACAPETGETAEGSAADAPAEGQETAAGSSTPDSFAESAWLTRAEDGARFVTYFDPDGTYRDMRNGDFLQAGSWTYADGPGGKQICLEPDADGSVKMCWQPDTMDGDTMTATGPEDRRIELERTTYVAPEDEGGAAAE